MGQVVGVESPSGNKPEKKPNNNNTTLRPSDVQNTFLSPGPRPRTIKLLRNKTLIAEHENSTVGFLTFISRINDLVW